MAHSDGEKTNKSELLKAALYSFKVDEIPGEKKDCYILDLASIIQSIVKVPCT